MLVPLENFCPLDKEFLVCVDSDGTVMDTMWVKHSRCLGPALVEEWGLEDRQGLVLKLWYDINLYRMTRGMMRFKALALALREINDTIIPIEGIKALEEWVEQAGTLSGDTLAQRLKSPHHPILEKALRWNETVNRKVGEVSLQDKVPFPGAAEGLKAAAAFADLAVISTANREALLEEWKEYDLLGDVDLLLAQDSGSKRDCIARLLEKGYSRDAILMVGDSPSDLEAARANGVWFYPILVGHEAESWEELCSVGFKRLRQRDYGPYEAERLEAFQKNLGA